MKTFTYITYYYTNRFKSQYKVFAVIPALGIIRDTQAKDLGYSSWNIYFEWLWFAISLDIDTEPINEN